MIEAIAKAIYEGRNGKGCKAWARLPKAHQEPYRADARAAVEVMADEAPDMLEALKTFVAHYPMGINPFLDDAYRDARAAISKAEGK